MLNKYKGSWFQALLKKKIHLITSYYILPTLWQYFNVKKKDISFDAIALSFYAFYFYLQNTLTVESIVYMWNISIHLSDSLSIETHFVAFNTFKTYCAINKLILQFLVHKLLGFRALYINCIEITTSHVFIEYSMFPKVFLWIKQEVKVLINDEFLPCNLISSVWRKICCFCSSK